MERTARQRSKVLRVHAIVYHFAKKLRERTDASSSGACESSGPEKPSESYLSAPNMLAGTSPWATAGLDPVEPAMLIESMRRKAGVNIDVATLIRALTNIKARGANTSPRVAHPMRPALNAHRLNSLRQLVAMPPRREAAVSGREADVHLKRKIGQDRRAIASRSRLGR
jgi:hypothetical protein